MIREPQGTRDVVIGFTLVNSAGGNATGEAANITAIITGPTGTAVTGFTPPTITETAHAGNYIAVFSKSADVKAFTAYDSGNPYHVSFDSSTTGIDPTGIIEVEISGMTPIALGTEVYNNTLGIASLDTLLRGSITTDINSRATQTSVNTLAGYVDTEITTLLNRIGTPAVTIAADIAAISGGGGGNSALVSTTATQTVTLSGTESGSGDVSITINATTYVSRYGEALADAGFLRAYINADANSAVTATNIGGVITLVAKVTGSSGNNITVDVSSTNDKILITSGGATLTGGTDGLFDQALPESYAADGQQPTMIQILYMMYSLLSQKSISSTTLTAKKLDGTTTAMTFTMDNALTPTSITRTT